MCAKAGEFKIYYTNCTPKRASEKCARKIRSAKMHPKKLSENCILVGKKGFIWKSWKRSYPWEKNELQNIVKRLFPSFSQAMFLLVSRMPNMAPPPGWPKNGLRALQMSDFSALRSILGKKGNRIKRVRADCPCFDRWFSFLFHLFSAHSACSSKIWSLVFASFLSLPIKKTWSLQRAVRRLEAWCLGVTFAVLIRSAFRPSFRLI